VTPITTATNTAGHPITTGSDPWAIAITPDGTTAYVDNAGSGTVTPITTATNTAGHPITTGSEFSDPMPSRSPRTGPRPTSPTQVRGR
jgi:YVTN family beta-propeller protein